MPTKTLEELNHQFEDHWQKEERVVEQSFKRKASSTISSVLFYIIIGLMVLGAFIYSQKRENGNGILGYSYFNILTDSMKSEMPAGTFILVKAVDPYTIEIGDDITFKQDKTTVITHRVIDILNNYEDSGQLGFQTKGTDNVYPDKDITYEGNVIGKVIWSVPALGFIFEYIADNVLIILIVFAALVLLVFLMRVIFKKDKAWKDNKADFVNT